MKRTVLKLTVAAMLLASVLSLAACAEASDAADRPNGAEQTEQADDVELADGADWAETVTTTAIEIENHGHVQLDITAEEFESLGYDLGDVVTVRTGGSEWDMPYFDGYYSNPTEHMVRAEEPFEPIAVCINYGSFAEETGMTLGEEVTISPKEKAGAIEAQKVYSLDRSYDRVDYMSDEVYANFRPVTAGELAEGRLYRSSSPIDPDLNRQYYANQLAEQAGVATVLNFADSAEEIEGWFEEEGFESFYYQDLYKSGQVMLVELNANFFSDEFAQSLVEGLEFLADNDAPYLIHCKEGKDRAGFVSMLLGALMGASLDELVSDYLQSYENYYRITEISEVTAYYDFLELNMIVMMEHVAGVEEGASLEGVDLRAAAERYLLDAGMDAEKLETLKAKLS